MHTQSEGHESPGQSGSRNHGVFWLENVSEIVTTPSSPGCFDVIVVGAGYTGLSAALTLSNAGWNVAVLEAGRIGEGASSLSAGSLGGIPKAAPAQLAAKYGDAASEQVYKEYVYAREFVAKLIQTLKLDGALQRGARIIAAHSARSMHKLTQYVPTLQKSMDTVIILDRTELAQRIASDSFHGGLLLPNTLTLQPAKLHLGLARAVLDSGANLQQHCRVLDVKPSQGAYKVNTTRGAYSARHVIVATNAQTGHSVRAFRPISRRLAIIPAFVIATEPLPNAQVRDILGPANSFSDTYKLLHYLAVSPDGRRLIMSARAGFTEGTLQNKAERIFRYFQRHFRGLDTSRISHAWSGVFALSADFIPHIGNESGMHYVAGCCGTGVTMSAYLGHKVALKILGDPNAPTIFDRPLPPMPRWMRTPPIMAIGMRAHILYDQYFS